MSRAVIGLIVVSLAILTANEIYNDCLEPIILIPRIMSIHISIGAWLIVGDKNSEEFPEILDLLLWPRRFFKKRNY